MRADLLIFDGRHLLWRTADAFRELSAVVEGQTMSTGGMYGFLSVALRIHSRFGGQSVVAWEGKNNFRLDLYPSYKRKNEEAPPERLDIISEMSKQEKSLSGLLAVMGVYQYIGRGCEADDVIGRLALEGKAKGKRVVIYSGDSDLRQLVCRGVSVVAPAKRAETLYTPRTVRERHGVPPRLLAQLKAMAGDNSDNIPGAPGVGPVTAATLLNHYGTLRKTLLAARANASDWPCTPRIRDIVASSAVAIAGFHKLTKIRTDCPWMEVEPTRSQAEVIRRLKLFKFRSLASPAELHGLMKMGTS